MMVNRVDPELQKLGHKFLGQLQSLVFKAALNGGATVLGLVKDNFGLWQRSISHGVLRNSTDMAAMDVDPAEA
jgi:hypothetical protein